MVGVAAFAYALAHLSLYIVDQKYDLLHVASEIVLRFYLTIGFVTLLGLGALAATSTDAMIKRLGAARWNRLHKIVYALGGDRDLPLLSAVEGRRFRACRDDRVLPRIDDLSRAVIKRAAPVWAAVVGCGRFRRRA